MHSLNRIQQYITKHQFFLLLFLLFVSFRLLAILLFRPGGFIADFSDYDFYYAWGELLPKGYRVYDNLWTAYPPLFPAIMLPIFELSASIPPWVEPRLFFHVIFGLTLLLFEMGNLILIYRLSQRLYSNTGILPVADIETNPNRATGKMPVLLPPLIYALLFVPVYTMIGWFEAMPLFFMLLGLELLLIRTTNMGWILSAIAAALGFLTKLTPAMLVPVAIRWLGSRLSWQAARYDWFNRHSSGNLLRPTLYVLLFFGTVIGVGYPIASENPSLALSSFRIQGSRPPWQSIWALLEGYYGFGLVPIDMRNVAGLGSSLWESSLPWTWITLGFGLLYLWLYTRHYDWTQPRTPVALTAVSVILLFLYSKGWSPQFLLWILAFIVLLLPTVRGVLIAITLSLINFVEANVFLILLPNEQWIMTGTVILRTALLITLMITFLAQIWPQKLPLQMATRTQLRRVDVGLSWLLILTTLVCGVLAVPPASQAYQDRRFAEHPCHPAINYLRQQATWPNNTLLTPQRDVWHGLYPWLHEIYDFHVLDDYSLDAEMRERPLTDVVAEQLDAQLGADEVWWLTQDTLVGSFDWRLVEAAQPYFAEAETHDLHMFEAQVMGGCTLQRMISLTDIETLAVVDVSDAEGENSPSIYLQHVHYGEPRIGEDFHLVLYWEATAPIQESYTVFTQILNEQGQLVAQQDNLPVEGLAPTNTWAVNKLIRDPYRLSLPAELTPGSYQILVGMYNKDGRRPVTYGTDDHSQVYEYYVVPIILQ
ncbi:MAG: hypothetical protein AAF639_35125 [Chloroflexota bacterium]